MITRIHPGARVCLLSTLCLGAAATTLGDTYTIQDLGSLAGWTIPRAISESGDITGSTVAPDWHDFAFLWNGALVPLGPPPGATETQGMDLNSTDDLVVIAYSLGRVNASAARIQASGPTDLGAFAPSALNATGAVVGTREVAGAFGINQSEAVLQTGGVVSALPNLPGGDGAHAFDISDAGEVVGGAFGPGGLAPRAVLWSGGSIHDLGTLGGATAQALAISNSRFVCGVSATAAAPLHAFRFRLNGAAVMERIDLGTLAGGWSVAYDVNDQGWVVGTSDDRAFLWTDGQMWDLNAAIDPSKGWRLIGATSINGQSEIVGWGEHQADGLRAFLLTFAPPSECVGDVTGDGLTSIADFNILASNFGNTVAPDTSGDLTGDGFVTIADFNILAGDFGCGFTGP